MAKATNTTVEEKGESKMAVKNIKRTRANKWLNSRRHDGDNLQRGKSWIVLDCPYCNEEFGGFRLTAIKLRLKRHVRKSH